VVLLGMVVVVHWAGDTYSVEQKQPATEKPAKPAKIDKLIIAHTEFFGRLERPQVVFNHSLHTDKLKDKSCDACHPASPEGNFDFSLPFKLAGRDRKSVMDSYHDRCIGCHNKMASEKKKAGPVQCGGCHMKEFDAVSIKYPVAEFDFLLHDKHDKKLQEKKIKDNCRFCHHVYNGESVYEEGTEQSCYYCHDEQKKRGPTLAVETGITEKKGLTVRRVSHLKCLNCHMAFKKLGEKAGPTACSECHTNRYRTVAELEKVPRPKVDQPAKAFLKLDEGKMKGVPFNHKFHEQNNRTCRSCHHETLSACKQCHGLLDKPGGKFIKAADAAHTVRSEESCMGCHNKKLASKDCSGCHRNTLESDLQNRGPASAVCESCHSGQKNRPETSKPIDVAQLKTLKVPEKVKVNVMERLYDPTEFPHSKMITKLITLSNDSKMARYFHRNIRTICAGCHHRSDSGAETEKNKPLLCRNCHSISFDSQDMNRPRLQAAYHQECKGCHDRMQLKAVECKDCHKEKAVLPANILQRGQ
jgi:hypothetical protein